jgi:hypothetical protein
MSRPVGMVGPVPVPMPDVGTVLALDLRGAQALLAEEAPGWTCVIARFAHVDATLLGRVSPDLVMFPLFGPGFDALQVVERLGRLGYRGRLCCVTGPLPAPEVVRAELERANGGRRLSLITRPT